jgi:SAM-dependent methyltransferase
MSETAQELQTIYRHRFNQTANYRNRIWQVLTRSFFNQWVGQTDAVLDLGCGYGEFINNIVAREKYAMDLNPDSAGFLTKEVIHLEQDCSAPWQLPDDSLDAVFTSNFFEHLPNKECLKQTLHHAFRCLKPGGRLVAMGPNIKYLTGLYWDFFDHHTILTESSLAEVLELVGFRLHQVTPRFLPYTMVNSPEYPLFLLRIYLTLPIFWPLRGRQFLVVATKPN